MKLYATTTSERATKGQGGNEFLNIKLLIDNNSRFEIGILRLETLENGRYLLALDRSNVFRESKDLRVYEEIIDTLKKGKKKKDETCLTCNNTGQISSTEKCLNCNE